MNETKEHIFKYNSQTPRIFGFVGFVRARKIAPIFWTGAVVLLGEPRWSLAATVFSLEPPTLFLLFLLSLFPVSLFLLVTICHDSSPSVAFLSTYL